MRIIKPGRMKGDAPAPLAEEVPFVPAYDLLEEMENRLSEEEIIGIAVALQHLSGGNPGALRARSRWQTSARLEGTAQTELKE